MDSCVSLQIYHDHTLVRYLWVLITGNGLLGWISNRDNDPENNVEVWQFLFLTYVPLALVKPDHWWYRYNVWRARNGMKFPIGCFGTIISSNVIVIEYYALRIIFEIHDFLSFTTEKRLHRVFLSASSHKCEWDDQTMFQDEVFAHNIFSLILCSRKRKIVSVISRKNFPFLRKGNHLLLIRIYPKTSGKCLFKFRWRIN